MHENANKEKWCPISVDSSEQSPVIYISADVSYSGEGEIYSSSIVYCQEQAGDDLHAQAQAQQRAEISPDWDISGDW